MKGITAKMMLEIQIRAACEKNGCFMLTEFCFAKPARRWRFDYVPSPLKIGIEFEGGVFGNGAHTRGKHYSEDCDKYNYAARLGWKVYRFTAKMMDDAAATMDFLEAAIREEMEREK